MVSHCVNHRAHFHVHQSVLPISIPLNHSWHVLHTPHKVDMIVGLFHVSCAQETYYRPHFKCGGFLDFLEHFKDPGQCVNAVRLSADGIRAFPRTNKICMHAHHHDHSTAAAIFANITYSVDMPCVTCQC
jgi:hypothetical protein